MQSRRSQTSQGVPEQMLVAAISESGRCESRATAKLIRFPVHSGAQPASLAASTQHVMARQAKALNFAFLSIGALEIALQKLGACQEAASDFGDVQQGIVLRSRLLIDLEQAKAAVLSLSMDVAMRARDLFKADTASAEDVADMKRLVTTLLLSTRTMDPSSPSAG